MVNLNLKQPWFIKKWNRKIGYAAKIVSQPCQPSPVISVLAAWVNIPWVIATIIKPSPIDNTFDRIGRRHKVSRKWSLNADLVIKGELGLAEGRLTWALFKMAALAEHAGFFFLMVDATADWIVNWSTTAYSWAGCDVPPECQAQGHLPAINHTNLGGDSPLSSLWTEDSHENAIILFDGGSTTLPTTKATAVLHVTIGRNDDPTVEFVPPVLWLASSTVGGETVRDDLTQTVEIETGNYLYSGGVERHVAQARRWNFVPMKNTAAEGGYKILGAELSITGGGTDGIGPDP